MENTGWVRPIGGGLGGLYCKHGVSDEGSGDALSHGARPVHQIISTIKWNRTSKVSIKNSLWGWGGGLPSVRIAWRGRGCDAPAGDERHPGRERGTDSDPGQERGAGAQRVVSHGGTEEAA